MVNNRTTETVEKSFTLEFEKALKELEAEQVHAITSYVVEDYEERVGYIRAIRDVRSKYNDLMQAFFGT